MSRFIVCPTTLDLHAAGVSVQQVAEAMGVTRAAVAHYLAGRRHPRPDLIPTIARLAGDQVARKIARKVGVHHG